MPVLIPIIVAGAAYIGSTAVVGMAITAGMVAAGSFAAIAVGVVAGAVIGAAVGAIGAAVTGGDIGKGALWGAVGGAVAGGFAGWSATPSTTATATTGTGEGLGTTYGEGANMVQGTGTNIDAAASQQSILGGAGKLTDGMGAAAITTAGNAISGYAKGEAAAGMSEEQIAAADKARQEEFAQRMKEIEANHAASMESINAQTASQMAQADKNNAAQMAMLQTRIGADKDTVTQAQAREDQKVAGYNESVRGTDADLFNRPTFKFEPGAESEFDSGFNDAVAQSPNNAGGAATGSAQGEPVATITVEQLAEIKKQQEAAA